VGRPRTNPEGMTASDRVKQSVALRRAEGWTRLDVLLPPGSSADLDAIAAKTGETKIDVLVRLLREEARSLLA
jgi:hypothetical protein